VDCDLSQTLLHGYLDGELDVVTSLALTTHLQDCATCTRLYTAQQALRTALRQGDLYHLPPPAFQQRWRRAWHRASRAEADHPWWRGWWLPLGVVVSAALLLLVWSGAGRQRGLVPEEHLLQDVIAGHVRSLMVNHLTDVASADQHTVKPWFEGALDFSPPVPDLTAQGFVLIGGRLDYLANRPVAALVYRRQQHAINLFIWPTTPAMPRPPQSVTRQGYHLVTWTTADLTYWAVSTLNMAELTTFAHLIGAGT
jgi:anti-sigma factor RsiW